jgi:hypothetical protein
LFILLGIVFSSKILLYSLVWPRTWSYMST